MESGSILMELCYFAKLIRMNVRRRGCKAGSVHQQFHEASDSLWIANRFIQVDAIVGGSERVFGFAGGRQGARMFSRALDQLSSPGRFLVP